MALIVLAADFHRRYEMLYGTPVDVSLADLVQNPMAYSNRAVRTTGRLEMSPSIQNRRTYILSDSAVDIALLQPVPEIGVNRDFEEAVSTLKKGEVSQPVAAPGVKSQRVIVAFSSSRSTVGMARGADEKGI